MFVWYKHRILKVAQSKPNNTALVLNTAHHRFKLRIVDLIKISEYRTVTKNLYEQQDLRKATTND